MNMPGVPPIDQRERVRLAALAYTSRAIEWLIFSKLRAKGYSGSSRTDRAVLTKVHARMMREIERLRSKRGILATQEKLTHAKEGMHNAHVILRESDPAIRDSAAHEIAELQHMFGAPARVFHIGSTAVEGLAAKPIADLALTFPDADFEAKLDDVFWQLRRSGYRFLGVRGGLFFEKGPLPIRTHALQLHPAGSQILAELLRFRDALAGDARLRNDYEVVKAALAAHFADSRLLYVFYKSHWIDDWQWRHSQIVDWTDWTLSQKRAHAALARAARRVR